MSVAPALLNAQPSSPIVVQTPTNDPIANSQLESVVARTERSVRTNRAARIAFITLGVAFAAGTVAIGFFALPLIAASIPLAIVFFILAAVSYPKDTPGTDFYVLRSLLRSTDTDLLHRYGKCCKTIELDAFDPQIKISIVKNWILEECQGAGFKAAMDQALPVIDPNFHVSSKLFSKLKDYFRKLREHSEKYEAATNSFDQQSVVSDATRYWLTEWNNIQKMKFPDTREHINVDSIPHLISGATNASTVSLGKCINAHIIYACNMAGVENIIINEDTPIFEETAKALAAMTSLKKLTFTKSLASKGARDILEQHFKTQSEPWPLHAEWTRI